MRPFLAVLVTFLVLSGCLGSGADDLQPSGTSLPVEEAARVAFDYACPPGGGDRLPGGLCVRSLWDAQETYEEPYLAVHPTRPEVLALGLNAWHAAPRLVLAPVGAATELVRMRVFVSEDGGAAWRELDLPAPRFGQSGANAVHGTVDPALAFDREGVLHITQLNAGFSGPFWFDVQYVATPDLGATWTEPVLIASDGDNDRNWLAIGPDGTVYVAWRNPLRQPLPPQLTWSRDGGRTWSPPVAPEGCTGGARPLVVDDGVLLACELGESNAWKGIAVHHLDPARATWSLRSEVRAPSDWDPGETLYTLWDATPSGTLAVVTRQGAPGAFLAVSRDAGATWEAPRRLADLCACRGAERLVAYWAEFDPWGGLHLLLRDGYFGTPDDPNPDNARYALGEVSTWHVVFDVDAGTIVQEKTLNGPDPGFRRVPQSAAPPIARDDYYRPAFWSDGGALAWTRDKGIDLTVLAPQ